MEHDANRGDLDHDLHGDFEGDFSESHLARIKAELELGERLLWASRPYPKMETPRFGLYLAPTVAVIFLAAACLAFANAWGYLGRPATDGSSFLGGCLFSTFGCLIGWFVVAGLWFQRNERIRMDDTLFAVTDRRALVWSPVGRSGSFHVLSVVLGRLTGVSRLEHPDGTGDLLFGSENGYCDFGEDCVRRPISFQHVPNVRQVERIVRQNLLNPDTTQAL